MDSQNGVSSPSARYRWPRYVIAAVVLAFVLAGVWMSFAIRQVRERRESNPLPSTAPSTNLSASAGTTNAAAPLDDRLAGFRDALEGGNAEQGRKIFFERPDANCSKCHKTRGQGGDLGPPLDGIGSRQTREYILESMISPNCRTLPGYESVVVLLKSGSGCAGMLKSENAVQIVINTPEDGLVTIRKDDIQVRQKGLSPMPEGFGNAMSRQDLRDLVEFVASLK